MFFPEYPYKNITDLNLDYILKAIRIMENEIENFINFNAIKYADPLAWNITTQYEGNTVVIDSNTGIAYLSTQAVPNGVAITNTNYWTAIFDMSQFFTDLGDVNDLLTTDKTSVVNAINEVFTSLQGQIDTRAYVTPEMFGAKGDGIEDDTAAIQAALDSGANAIIFNNTYLVTPQDVAPYYPVLDVPDNIIIDGQGTIQLDSTDKANYSIFNIRSKNNVKIKNISIIGDVDTHIGSTGEWGFGINIDDSSNIYVENVNVSKCWGDGIFIAHLNDGEPVNRNKNIHVTGCHCSYNRRNNLSVASVDGCYISKCEFDNARGTAPEAGIDVEPDNGITGEIVNNLFITDCLFHDNEARALEIDNFNTEQVNNAIISNCIFKDEAIGFRGVAGTNINSRPTIIGCQFINVNYPIYCDSMALNIFDNYFIGDVNTPRAFHLGGTGGKVSGNHISLRNDSAHIMYVTGTNIEISDNKFYNCKATTDIIDFEGAQCIITKNYFGDFNVSPNALITMESVNGTVITHNTMNAVNKPNNFINCVLSTGTEVIAFNNVHYSNDFINGTTLNAIANVRNGVFNP